MQALIETIHTIFDWVTGTSIQASLLFVIIFMLQVILRNRINAHWRYILWLLLLIRLSLPWSPETTFSIYNILPKQPITQHIVRNTLTSESNQIVSQTTLDISQTESIILRNKNGINHRKPLMNPVHIYAFTWLIGVIGISGFMLYQSGILIIRLSGKRPVTQKETLKLLEDCKELMGIQTYLAVVESSIIRSPVLFGWFRPRLLLPEGSLDTLTRDQLRYIFIHELSHLKRSDILVNYWMTALQLINWFNPLVWIACYLIRNEQEMACDELVLSYIRTTESSDYGKTLLFFLQKFSHHHYVPIMTGILENKNQIKRRIHMITAFKRHSRQFSIILMCILMLSTAFLLTNAKHDRQPEFMHVDLTQRAKSVLNSFLEGDFVRPILLFDQIQKEIETPEILKARWENVIRTAGEFENIVKVRSEGWNARLIISKHEMGNSHLFFSFDEYAKIKALLIIPAVNKENALSLTQEIDLTERAKSVLNSFLKGDFSAPVLFFDQEFKGMMSADRLQVQWENATCNSGDFKRIIEIRKDFIDPHKKLVLVLEMQNRICHLKISFNDNAEIEALYVFPVLNTSKSQKIGANEFIHFLVINWLSQVDKNKHDGSYREMAKQAKQQISSVQWKNVIQEAKKQFSAIISRELLSIESESQLPGLPTGEYRIFKFQSVFDKTESDNTIETVTIMKEGTGFWQVARYSIQ